MDKITVGARSSPLSKVQIDEVYQEICTFYPLIKFSCIFVETSGDKDQTTSLRNLEKTDFFTKEIDQMLLSKKCRIAIHSAKDLPETLPKGLTIAAITKGVDSRDVLVMRSGEMFDRLPTGAIIATSSLRREEVVKALRNDLTVVDIRGTIGQRLEKLESHEVDGVVIAEAALIRLKKTHYNRIYLPGITTPLQGKLAVVVNADDQEMLTLFAKVNQ